MKSKLVMKFLRAGAGAILLRFAVALQMTKRAISETEYN